MTFSGQTWGNRPDSLYKDNSCPVTFYTHPQPKLRETFNDTEAQYSDGWTYQTARGAGDYMDDAHVTSAPGQYCDFSFTGEGIEILSEKFHDLGDVEVILDGVSKGVFSLYQDPMPRLYQVPFYRNMDLSTGKHSLRVINRGASGTTCLIDGFKVYGSK